MATITPPGKKGQSNPQNELPRDPRKRGTRLPGPCHKLAAQYGTKQLVAPKEAALEVAPTRKGTLSEHTTWKPGNLLYYDKPSLQALRAAAEER